MAFLASFSMKSSNQTKSFSDVAHTHSGKSVFAAHGWKRALLKFKHASWKPIILGFVSVVMIGGILFWFRIGRSQTAAFYPSSCLGGWEHPENAQGKPDVDQGDSFPDQFTDQNSAVLRNAASQIYCGNFQGDIPEGSEPVRATIRFSVAFKQDAPTLSVASGTSVFNPEFPLLSPVATTTASSSDFVLPASTADVPMVQSPEQSIVPEASVSPGATESTLPSASQAVASPPVSSPSFAPSPDASPAAEPSGVPSPAPLPSPSAVVSSQPSPVNTASPVVWLLHALFREAFALDTASSTPDMQSSVTPSAPASATPLPLASPAFTQDATPSMASSTSVSLATSSPEIIASPTSDSAVFVTDSPLPEPTIENTPTVHVSSLLAGTPDSASSSLSTSANPSPEVASSTGALWEVLYTMDGKIWNHVAYLGQGNWNTVQAILPSFSWKDLATLQVSIQSLATGEIVPAVYLDSIWLEVGYAPGNLFEYIPLERVAPDFSSAFINALKASDGYAIAKVTAGSSTQLWGFDLTASTTDAFIIAAGTVVASDTPIGLKDKTGFWIDQDHRLRGFSFINMEYLRNKPLIDTSGDGFSVPVGHDQLRVVYHADEFGFDSPQTGEIFSDDDSGLKQEFYDRYLRGIDPARDDIVQQNFLHYGAAE